MVEASRDPVSEHRRNTVLHLICAIGLTQIGVWFGQLYFSSAQLDGLEPAQVKIAQIPGPDLVDDAQLHWYDFQLPGCPCGERLPERYSVIRLHAASSQLKQPIGIYLPLVRYSHSIYADGILIGGAGRTVEGHELAREPFLYRIPQLDGPHPHTIHVIVTRQGEHTPPMGPIWVGNYEELHNAWQRQYALEIILPWVAAPLIVVVGLLSIALGRALPDRLLLSFGCFAVSCGLFVLSLLTPNLLDSGLLNLLVNVAMGLIMAVTAINFLGRWGGWPLPRLLRWAIPVCSLSLLAVGIMTGVDYVEGYNLGNAVMRAAALVMCGFFVVQLVSRVIQGSDAPFAWYAALMLAAATLLIIDTVHSLSGGYFVTRYAPIALLIVVAAFAVDVSYRFYRTFRSLETAGRDNEKKLQAQQALLEEQHRSLLIAEKEQALSTERTRLMRDVHDGFGSQLTGLVMQLRRKDVDVTATRETLERSLQDLHLLVDSLEVAEDDLSIAFGALRGRLQELFAHSGVALAWRTDWQAAARVSSRSVLQVFRIVQEACSNVLRHSNGTQVEIVASCRDGDDGAQVQLQVRDNGIGFVERSTTQGQGLSNMRARAKEIGAVLDIQSAQTGTVVSLTFDVEAGTHSAVSSP